MNKAYSNAYSQNYSNKYTFSQVFVIQTSDIANGNNVINLIASSPSIIEASISQINCLLFLTGQITMVRIA
jgi:hypothetical protein